MKKIMAILLFVLIFITTSMPVKAVGNEWVFDEPKVISEETENYIKNLNENVFSTYKNKPQLGILFVNQLPSGCTIDEYKLEQFNLYGVGTAEENCGMLFVFSLTDRVYGFEIGDGYRKGSFLRQELETDFITEDMKNLLRAEDYDSVVMKITQHIEQIMLDEENGIYNQREIAFKEEQARQAEAINNFVDNFISFTFKLLVILVLAVASLTGIKFLYKLLTKAKRRKVTRNLLDKHRKYVKLTEIDAETLFCDLVEEKEDVPNDTYESDFLRYLYDFYVETQFEKLCTIAKETYKGKYDEHSVFQDKYSCAYEKRFQEVNTFDRFEELDIVSLDEIVSYVDNKIEQIEIINKDNEKRINDYVQEKREIIKEKSISVRDLKESIMEHCRDGVKFSEEQIKEVFEKELNELCFKAEYEKFLEENGDKIDKKYFDSNRFYKTIKDSPEYKSYNHRITFNNAWMLLFLYSHMDTRKEEIRIKKEREEARRQEEERRRERERREEAEREQQMRSSYSNFGGGFGGGNSTGGGFSGGW